MSRIDELIKQLCPNGVVYKKFEQVGKCSKGKQLNKDGLLESGKYPVINGGINPSGFWNEFNCNEDTITISQGGASAGYVQWQNTKFWAGAHCYFLINNDSKILNYRFLYHLFKMYEKKLTECQYGAGIPALAIKTINDLLIPVPPLEVQREIVEILDKFTLLTAELTAELTARKKQFYQYKNKLFSDCIDNNEGKWVTLNEIADIYDGTHSTPDYQESGVPFASVENIKNPYETRKYITYDAYAKYKIKPQTGDVFMTRIGSIGDCYVVDREDDLAYYVSLALIRPNKKCFSKYIKYYIESMYGKKELYKKTLVNAVPIKINKDEIGKIRFFLASENKQERIVSILDRFDSLCNDISNGLPAEIEARKKQYEYYRDRLLTFKEKEA